MTTIVVGVDGSEGAKAALAWACAEARRDSDAKIVAVSTWLSPFTASSPWVVGYDVPIDLSEATVAALKESVAAVADERFGDLEIAQRVVCGSAAGVLIAEGSAADILVVGSRGLGGFKGLLLGSVSHQVVTHAPCPTVIVPRPVGAWAARHVGPASIVVGVDGSPNSIAALQWAASRAYGADTIVHAVYVWRFPAVAVAPPPIGAWADPASTSADAAMEALAAFIAAAELPRELRVVPTIREGSPTKVLLDEGQHADLLVVGARGHEGFVGLLLGSVATAVTHHARCPVAVIPEK